MTIDAASLAGRRAGIALARLAVDAGLTVSRDALADALWGEQPPASWRPALRNEIAAIRAVLAAPALAGSVVVRAIGDGYRLELPPGASVDLADLETAVAAAGAAARGGDHEAARRLASDALVTATQAVLAGATGDWVDGLRDRVAELRERAQRTAGEAALALGDHIFAEWMARALIAASPLREDSHRMLIEALRMGGNIGAALTAYEACRRLLADELGSYPSEETEALFLSLLGATDSSAGAGSPLAGRRGAAPGTLLLLERQTDVIGRDALLAQLSERLEAARTGGPRFVAIGGEPGLGKTLVAARLAAQAHAAGLAVLYGRADEGIALTHGPFLEALDTYFGAFDPARTVAALGQHGAVLSRYLPSMADAAPDELDELTDDDVGAAIAHALEIAAGERGGLLVLDDMQWSGPETDAALDRIAAARAPLLVLLLHRRVEASALSRLPALERIALAPLTVEDVAGLAGDLAVPGDVAPAIWRESGGNPLLATELLCWSTGRRRFRPRRIADLLHERLAGLPDGTADVLATAAVAGLEFDPRLVVAASSGDPEDVRRSLAAAEQASMLAPAEDWPDGLAFRHGLLRSSLLEALGAPARLRVHQRLGSALDARRRPADADDDELVVTVTRAIDALTLAGDPDPSARRDLERLLPGSQPG